MRRRLPRRLPADYTADYPQTTPQTTPQRHQQSSPQTTLQMTPQINPQMLSLPIPTKPNEDGSVQSSLKARSSLSVLLWTGYNHQLRHFIFLWHVLLPRLLTQCPRNLTTVRCGSRRSILPTRNLTSVFFGTTSIFLAPPLSHPLT